jgi:hypothetical protein
MNQLELFLNASAQSQSDFPGEYVDNFLSANEADNLFRRFINFGICRRRHYRKRSLILKRRGISFVSDIHHPQVFSRNGETQ